MIPKDYLQQSMKIIRGLQHRRQYSWDLLYSGHLALANEQKADANRYYLEALMAAQEAQDQQSVAEALYHLAILAERDGNLDHAEDLHRESLELSKEVVQSAPHVANSHLQLEYLLLKRGKNREEGCSMISEAIQWYSDMGLQDDEIAAQEIARQFQVMCSESGT